VTTPTLDALLLILLGGLFGWVLGKLPDRWVFAVAAVAIVVGIVAFTN